MRAGSTGATMLAPMLLSCALAAGQATPAAGAAPALTWSYGADRWLLMKSLQGTWQGSLLDDNHLRVSGWTDMSFTASSDRVSNLPMGFNYLANNFLLQQNWLRIERGVARSGTTEPTFGFRSDTILPGSDYVFTLARGLFNAQLTADNGKPNRYGIDPIQFYGEAYLPSIGRGLDVKLGRFFGQTGIESNAAPDNYLVSHSYTFIYNPFTHTGLLTTLKWTEAWSSQAGLVLGSDNFIDPTDNPTFIGSVRRAPPTARDSLQFSVLLLSICPWPIRAGFAARSAVTITLGSRKAAVVPSRAGCTHTGGGNIDVAQPAADTVVVTMTGVAVAGAHPCKGSAATLKFDLLQLFEVTFDNPEVRSAKISLEARVIGLLRSHRGGGSAQTGPALASVSVAKLGIVKVELPAHGVFGGENLSINDREGPAAVPVMPGPFALQQAWEVSATHSQCLRPCKAASSEFAPDPGLDPLWISYWEPFHGAIKRDFGFQVTLKVLPDMDFADGRKLPD